MFKLTWTACGPCGPSLAIIPHSVLRMITLSRVKAVHGPHHVPYGTTISAGLQQIPKKDLARFPLVARPYRKPRAVSRSLIRLGPSDSSTGDSGTPTRSHRSRSSPWDKADSRRKRPTGSTRSCCRTRKKTHQHWPGGEPNSDTPHAGSANQPRANKQ